LGRGKNKEEGLVSAPLLRLLSLGGNIFSLVVTVKP
jgi:hypothetical protein